MRKKLESETGRKIQPIRVLDNIDLKELQYRIIVNGQVSVNNNLGIVPPVDRVSEMLKHLEFVIKTNIDVNF